MIRWTLMGTWLVAAACAPAPPLAPPPAPPPPQSFEPSESCQRALAQVVTLAIRATGEGPSDRQRSTFLERCVAAASLEASECVLALRALPGRRGGTVELAPALRCLKR